jgi:hypothetical protein
LGELGLGENHFATRGVTALARSRGLAGLYALDISRALAEAKAFREFLAPDCPFAFTRLNMGGYPPKPTREALRERYGHALS